MFFSFPEDARWNPERQAIEFGVGVGEYERVSSVSPAKSFGALLTVRLRQNAAWRRTMLTAHGSS